MNLSPEDFRKMRIALKLSQTEMAMMLGYGAPTRISEIENGRATPPPSVIRLMVAYMTGYRPDDWPRRKSPQR